MVRSLLSLAIVTPVALATEANPIRKVVSMLQNLEAKVQGEGAKEKELHDKYMCYCKNGVQTLEETITGNTGKVPKVQAAIEGAEAKVKQIKAELAQAQSDRDAAKASSDKATALREKEAAAFAKFKSV